MRPARGLLLVRPVDTAETYEGGRIVIPADARERLTAWQCEVVGVGVPALCEDVTECQRVHTDEQTHTDDCRAVGDWLLVRPRSYIATTKDKLWLIKQSDVLAVFSD